MVDEHQRDPAEVAGTEAGKGIKGLRERVAATETGIAQLGRDYPAGDAQVREDALRATRVLRGEYEQTRDANNARFGTVEANGRTYADTVAKGAEGRAEVYADKKVGEVRGYVQTEVTALGKKVEDKTGAVEALVAAAQQRVTDLAGDVTTTKDEVVRIMRETLTNVGTQLTGYKAEIGRELGETETRLSTRYGELEAQVRHTNSRLDNLATRLLSELGLEPEAVQQPPANPGTPPAAGS